MAGLVVVAGAVAFLGLNELFHHHAIWPAEDAFASYAKDHASPIPRAPRLLPRT